MSQEALFRVFRQGWWWLGLRVTAILVGGVAVATIITAKRNEVRWAGVPFEVPDGYVAVRQPHHLVLRGKASNGTAQGLAPELSLLDGADTVHERGFRWCIENAHRCTLGPPDEAFGGYSCFTIGTLETIADTKLIRVVFCRDTLAQRSAHWTCSGKDCPKLRALALTAFRSGAPPRRKP